MSLALRSSEATASAGIDPFLLSVLRCPDCLSAVVATETALACERCGRDYPLLGGVPSLFAATENPLEDQFNWDFFIGDNYQSVVDATAANLDEVDRVALPCCHGDLLDIGCGSGRFLSRAARWPRVARAVGLDVSAGMLAAATARGLERLVHGSGNRLPFADGAFDTVVSTFGSLMYVERPQGYNEIARVLRDGGVLVFDMLNYWPEYLDNAWTPSARPGNGRAVSRGNISCATRCAARGARCGCWKRRVFLSAR